MSIHDPDLGVRSVQKRLLTDGAVKTVDVIFFNNFTV